MIETLLSRLGLEAGEIQTYLALLEVGPMSAGLLAKKTGITRVTQYLFLKRLIEKGFVVQSKKQQVAFFYAKPLENIQTIYQERAQALEDDQKKFAQYITAQQKKQLGKFITPKFQLFEGKDELKRVLKDMLLYRDMETQAYWPIKQMINSLSADFFEEHNRERIRRNLFTRAIWPQDQLVDLKRHPYLGTGQDFKREIRIAPKNIDFTMGYWIYGNNVAFLSSLTECYGFIIESAEFRTMLLSQFELVWKLSKRLKPQPDHAKDFLRSI